MQLKSILAAALLALCVGWHARGAEPPEEPGVDHWAERAQEGDVEAMNYLGYLLLSGAEGVAKDPGAGLSWLAKAASLGDAKAASNLGWLYLQGEVVEASPETAAGWLRTAADKGLPIAQSLLGDLYRDGLGVARDSVAADSLYREAFEHGLADAGFKLYALNEGKYAVLPPEGKVAAGKYYYLRGAPSEGVKLFYMASDEGDAEAKALLGDAYTRAIGVPYDYALSKKYYVEAALGGNAPAQFVVGELLDIFPDALSDFDLPEEATEAAYWYGKAAEAGVTDAAIASDRLLKGI